MIRYEIKKVMASPLLLVVFLLSLLSVITSQKIQFSVQTNNKTVSNVELTQEEYEEYRNGIEKNASILLAEMSPESFDSSSIEKTMRAYEKLGEVEIKEGVGNNLEGWIDNHVIDIVCLLLVILCVMRMLCCELESGTWELLRTTFKGRDGVLKTKLYTLVMLIVVIVLLFYGLTVGMILTKQDDGLDWDIQSIYRFISCTLPLTAKQFVGWNLVVKLLVFLLYGILIGAVCIFTKRAITSLVIVLGVIGGEYILWSKITINSWAALLKECNLIALLRTEHFFSDYYNVNIFNLAVSNRMCGVIFCSMLLIVELWYWFKADDKEERKIINKKDQRKIITKNWRKNLWCYEWYKLLIGERGWIVVLACVVAGLTLFFHDTYMMTQGEYFYKMYATSVEGDVTETKIANLENEKERWMQNDNESTSEIRCASINRVQRELETIRNAEDEIRYVYRTPWEYLIGETSRKYDMKGMGICILLGILFSAPLGAVEKESNMILLLPTLKKSERTVFWRKMFNHMVLSVGLYIMCFLPHILKIFALYGDNGVGIDAYSFFCYDQEVLSVLEAVTLAEVMVMKYVGMAVFYVIIMFIEVVLSQRIKNTVLTIIMGMILFEIPLLLVGVVM